MHLFQIGSFVSVPVSVGACDGQKIFRCLPYPTIEEFWVDVKARRKVDDSRLERLEPFVPLGRSPETATRDDIRDICIHVLHVLVPKRNSHFERELLLAALFLEPTSVLCTGVQLAGPQFLADELVNLRGVCAGAIRDWLPKTGIKRIAGRTSAEYAPNAGPYA